jgi:hypothetical protein
VHCDDLDVEPGECSVDRWGVPDRARVEGAGAESLERLGTAGDVLPVDLEGNLLEQAAQLELLFHLGIADTQARLRWDLARQRRIERELGAAFLRSFTRASRQQERCKRYERKTVWECSVHMGARLACNALF